MSRTSHTHQVTDGGSIYSHKHEPTVVLTKNLTKTIHKSQFGKDKHDEEVNAYNKENSLWDKARNFVKSVGGKATRYFRGSYKKVTIAGISLVAVITALLMLPGGHSLVTSGDIICGETCVSYINYTNYDLKIILENISNAGLNFTFEGEIQGYEVFIKAKDTWVNSISDAITWMPNETMEFKLVGHKSKDATVKWTVCMGDDCVDPLWLGVPNAQVEIEGLCDGYRDCGSTQTASEGWICNETGSQGDYPFWWVTVNINYTGTPENDTLIINSALARDASYTTNTSLKAIGYVSYYGSETTSFSGCSSNFPANIESNDNDYLCSYGGGISSEEICFNNYTCGGDTCTDYQWLATVIFKGTGSLVTYDYLGFMEDSSAYPTSIYNCPIGTCAYNTESTNNTGWVSNSGSYYVQKGASCVTANGFGGYAYDDGVNYMTLYLEQATLQARFYEWWHPSFVNITNVTVGGSNVLWYNLSNNFIGYNNTGSLSIDKGGNQLTFKSTTPFCVYLNGTNSLINEEPDYDTFAVNDTTVNVNDAVHIYSHWTSSDTMSNCTLNWNATGSWDDADTTFVNQTTGFCNFTIAIPAAAFGQYVGMNITGNTTDGLVNTTSIFTLYVGGLTYTGISANDTSPKNNSNVIGSAYWTDVGGSLDYCWIESNSTDIGGSGTVAQQFYDGFEGGTIDSLDWYTIGDPGTYNRTVIVPSGAANGTYAVRMDVDTNNHYETNILKTKTDFTDAINIRLTFWTKETNDELNACTDHDGDDSNCDGVFFTCNGTRWYELWEAPASFSSWTYSEVINISADSDFCPEINSSFAIKFTQYDNYISSTDGIFWDDIDVDYDIVQAGAGGGNTTMTDLGDTSPAWCNITFKVAGAMPTQVWWRQWANNSANTVIVTDWQQITLDDTAPKYSDITTTRQNGDYREDVWVNATWEDNYDLGWVILEANYTSGDANVTFHNDSFEDGTVLWTTTGTQTDTFKWHGTYSLLLDNGEYAHNITSSLALCDYAWFSFMYNGTSGGKNAVSAYYYIGNGTVITLGTTTGTDAWIYKSYEIKKYGYSSGAYIGLNSTGAPGEGMAHIDIASLVCQPKALVNYTISTDATNNTEQSYLIDSGNWSVGDEWAWRMWANDTGAEWNATSWVYSKIYNLSGTIEMLYNESMYDYQSAPDMNWSSILNNTGLFEPVGQDATTPIWNFNNTGNTAIDLYIYTNLTMDEITFYVNTAHTSTGWTEINTTERAVISNLAQYLNQSIWWWVLLDQVPGGEIPYEVGLQIWKH